jgi:hypothetical protein
MKPIAIVDVDETLWGFNTTLHALARDKGIKLPPTNECDHWDSLYRYEPREKVMPLFNEIHSTQCSYRPFPDAEKFLKFMKERHYVIIASHRDNHLKPELVEWLKTNNLVHDEVIVTRNKEVLFKNPRVDFVIDDKGETILAAQNHGKCALGLKRPWNRKIVENEFLFDSLTDIEKHIRTVGIINQVMWDYEPEMPHVPEGCAENLYD